MSPLNQSRAICRLRTLRLDRHLRCSCATTAKEVELSAFAYVAVFGFAWASRRIVGRRHSRGIEEYASAAGPLIAFALLCLLV
jgi:hypothetical protein